MAATDLVPCFYTGQDYRWERPAKMLTRARVRELKTIKIGKFIESGKIFLFHQRLEAEKVIGFWDGPLGIGNLLPFARPHNYGEKLHYEIPHAGDRSCFARHRPRHVRVSSRNLFGKQPIPAVRLAV
jgi:hypothetical protein